MNRLPPGTLIAFYGDDFTGSTAVAEVLTFAGLPTVLFLDVPTAEQSARFAGWPGIGIAGVARSMSPAWMERTLPPVFEHLRSLSAPITHYKVCSTLDSAPHVGSIGRAVELAAPRLGGRWHPLVLAAPAIARYQAFGTLFAAVEGEAFRLDRHPTMSRHPVTPMHEADVRRHLARQTDMPIGLIDLVALKSGRSEERLEACPTGGMVALDVVDEESLEAAGRLIWEQRGDRLFAVGSQGVEYALVAHWRARGMLPPAPDMRLERAARVAVVSGSCSPVTAAQIRHATAHGFTGIRIDAGAAVDERRWAAEIERVAAAAREAVARGSDPLAYTATGPDDPAIGALAEALAASGADRERVHERIGCSLGLVLDRVMSESGIDRGVIAGGDSSGHAAMAMGIEALSARAPVAPGSMLCTAHRRNGDLELALKGGQMGGVDYFTAVKG
ncbi:MAG: four-carbon acid sugar kinase family protein [Geminicoccaceae bacterium]|nr:four-carbon acid sugar kinase family protein [Geminicoccaceae bacterium]